MEGFTDQVPDGSLLPIQAMRVEGVGFAERHEQRWFIQIDGDRPALSQEESAQTVADLVLRSRLEPVQAYAINTRSRGALNDPDTHHRL